LSQLTRSIPGIPSNPESKLRIRNPVLFHDGDVSGVARGQVRASERERVARSQTHRRNL
jgi:hypothetical protein